MCELHIVRKLGGIIGLPVEVNPCHIFDMVRVIGVVAGVPFRGLRSGGGEWWWRLWHRDFFWSGVAEAFPQGERCWRVLNLVLQGWQYHEGWQARWVCQGGWFRGVGDRRVWSGHGCSSYDGGVGVRITNC